MKLNCRFLFSRMVKDRDVLFVAVILLLCFCLIYLPTGFEDRYPRGAMQVRGEIETVDNSMVQQFGLVKSGSQDLIVRVLSGSYKGRQLRAVNHLVGKMELDKFFQPGDRVLLVLNVDGDTIVWANAADHYRLHTETALFGLFSIFLIMFAGRTGARALLSFVFTALMIWKILVPGFLKSWDPVVLALGVAAVLTAAIIFLVAGLNRKGFTAFLGAFLGLLLTCVLSMIFSRQFHLHGAVRPFSETLLYSGFPHLNLTRIFLAGIFIASSSAVMDLAMDIAAAMHEMVKKKPDISITDSMFSGFAVGRSVIGTMTTTLLLAYSGGYVTMLMVFMAQGVPLINVFTMNYVAAEVLNTLVGSFGLLTVAPVTAVTGAFIYAEKTKVVAWKTKAQLSLRFLRSRLPGAVSRSET